jgi:hypothetical protein
LHLLLDFAIFAFLIGTLGLLSPSAQSAQLIVDPTWSNFSLIFVAFPLFLWYIFLFLRSFFSHTIYSTPLSRVVWHLGDYIKLIVWFPFSLLKSLIMSLMSRRSNAFIRFDWVTLDGADQVADRMTKALPPSLDDEIVTWLLATLYHDQDFEQFLESIPSFYRSDHVKNPDQIFRRFHEDQVPHAIMAFVHRTLSSATTSHDIKRKRIRLALDVMELDPYLHQRTFSDSHLLSPTSKLTTLEYVDDLISDPLVDKANAHEDTGDAIKDSDVRLLANCITAIAISRSTPPQTPDGDHWSSVVKRRLRPLRFQISTPPSPEQLASVKLINLVRLVESLRSSNLKRREKTVSETLLIARDFQVSGAGDEDKDHFCRLWNELQVSADGDRTSNAGLLLRDIQPIYNALHEGVIVNPLLTRCTTHVPLSPGSSTVTVSESESPPSTVGGDSRYHASVTTRDRT